MRTSRTTGLLLPRFWCVGLCLAALPGCSTYYSLLGYPSLPRPRDFDSYHPRFEQQNAQALAHSKLMLTGVYYRVVPGRGYSYLKFRADGSFFTAFIGQPPQQFDLMKPVDTLGYFTLTDDSARYELKTASNHTGFTGTFHFYPDSLLMRENPLRRKDKPNLLVYRHYATP